mgnify:CR=1 FL=1
MADEHRSGLDPEAYHRLTGFEGDWRDSWWDQSYLEFIAKELGLERIEEALDLGCGVGHWGQRLLPLLADGARLQGVDAEPTWMEMARTRAAGLNATYQVARAEALPFADESFDLVTCQTLLMHVAEPAAVVREALRVLRHGGLLLVAEPNNLGNAGAHMAWEPRAELPELLALMELEYVCARGKEALGEGWYAIAERLPSLFEGLGLHDVGARLNNQCNPWVPPYDRDPQGIAMMRDAYEQGSVSLAGGTRDNGRRMFLAGGGTVERFESLWQQAREHDAGRLRALDQGRAASAGGHLHYLVWGRKN